MFGPLALGDGTVLDVRQLTSADGPELERAIGRLSDDSRYLRFLTPLPHVPRRTLERLSGVDHVHEDALLALDPASGDGVAVARFAELADDGATVDIAVTVDDAWQGRGVGSVMLARILLRARDTGHATAHATTLAENYRALRLLESAGFRRVGSAGTTVELERPLRPRGAPPGGDNASESA